MARYKIGWDIKSDADVTIWDMLQRVFARLIVSVQRRRGILRRHPPADPQRLSLDYRVASTIRPGVTLNNALFFHATKIACHVCAKSNELRKRHNYALDWHSPMLLSLFGRRFNHYKVDMRHAVDDGDFANSIGIRAVHDHQ
jgi:hypothetical protein